MRCRYCFYHAVSESRSVKNYGMMSIEILEQLVKNALGYAEGYCCFAFQGGEPTLIGLDFYRQLIEFQKKYAQPGVKIENTIQTNGVLIDDEWARFLGENHFLAGLSLDGPRKINDCNRIDADNGGSFQNIMQTIDILRKRRVDFNILSVITSPSAGSPDYLYRFYTKQGFDFLQFIPCLDDNRHAKPDYALKTGQYGEFLSRMFTLWKTDFDGGRKTDIRFFSNLVQMAAGYAPEACGMSGHCTPYPVVEGDGSVYPCDFYVTDEWKLGDVYDDFTVMLGGEKAKMFSAPSQIINEKCRECSCFMLCRGGCRRWREPIADGVPAVNRLCEDYQIFFAHCAGGIIEMARKYLGGH